MGVLEGLHFDNLALRNLPVDTREGSERRRVTRACYARVKPTPVKNPRLVAASPSALALLDLDMSEVVKTPLLLTAAEHLNHFLLLLGQWTLKAHSPTPRHAGRMTKVGLCRQIGRSLWMSCQATCCCRVWTRLPTAIVGTSSAALRVNSGMAQ